MEDSDISRLQILLDERTMALMERESDLADRTEEMNSQKEELQAAIEELEDKNQTLTATLSALEERNKELDQILYRCSHDLKGPISSILGILNILRYESLNGDQKTCIDHIQSRTMQMEELLRALSALAKAISGDVNFGVFNLITTAQGCIGDFASHPNFNQLKIHFHSQGNEEVYSDRLLISIIIKNLLANSLIFRNPEIEGFIKLSTWANDQAFEIIIEDDGEGIPDNVRDHIFEMFYRGSERSNGSGLGLYIVNKIVGQLGGSINFSSRENSTMFKIMLPFKK